jgi:tellurite resistance protein TerC
MAHLWLWAGLLVVIVFAVGLDLGVHRNQHRALPLRSAIGWSLLWIGLSLGYGVLVWWRRGTDHAVDFYTAYLVEKSLSFDNLVVFLLLFNRLKVPEGERHRVLTWGIVGALVLRAIMIFGGVALLRWWHPVVYLFGGFLAYTGLRTMFGGNEPDGEKLTQQRWVRALKRILPFVPRYDGGHFFTVENGKRVGTMLLFALVIVELSDLMFAVDSIPAVIGITSDPQIVFSSNVLAVMGMRALFMVVEHAMTRVRYLSYGIGLVLILIGVKMCLSDLVHVPPVLALAVTLGVLTLTVVLSRISERRSRAKAPAPPPPEPRGARDVHASAPAP